MKMWYDNIHSIKVLQIDYGLCVEYQHRYDYQIIAFDEEGNEDPIIGTFQNKQKALDRMVEIKRLIVKSLKRKCDTTFILLTKKTAEMPLDKSNHLAVLESRRITVRNQRAAQKREDNRYRL